ncbi:hypothetical protein E0Z10_g922 [Xylaria hypoxylon]|uniref:Uncharacterized protein n=1 Tax=Xylaria hypoxylon TaxID=37992 RepID=A0A4Z0ZG50_9PEZI|nr:hypothetical protein E0Z10_g922 [Xylaria hypoxylon]
MAHSFGSAFNIASSTPNLSPSDILGDTKTRRALVKIPSTQKELLNRHEAWASFLSRRPNGFVNIPPDVLEEAKASYARENRAAQLNHVAGLGSRTGDDTDAPEPSGSQSSLHSCLEDGDEDGNDNENDGEPISCPQTPSPHIRPSRVASEEPNQPFITQLFEKSPPQPTIVTSPAENPKLPEFPQSSQGPEDELELEVPVALAYNLAPINKSALPMVATPPSAQVVPCTFEQSTQSGSASASKESNPQRKPKLKKRIYNGVSAMYRGPKQGAISSHLNTNVGSAKAIVALGHNTNAESSLSTNDTSSSIVPSTTDDRRIESEKHAEAWNIEPGQMSTYGANLSPGNPHSPLASGRYSPAQIQHVLSPITRSRQAVPPIAPPIAASKSWEAPFVHYTATYPNYNGTIQDFITACIYIQLQYRRIRTSLYDDFIRAWVQGYLPYVRDCDEAQPPGKALRAIEWYNEIDDDPLFTSRVVTRQNLQSMLNFYPNELGMARLSLGIFSSQGRSERSGSNSQTEPHIQENCISQSPTTAQKSKGIEVARRSVGKAEAEAQVTNKQMPPAHRSFNGIETRPAQHKGLTRSLSESTMHKKRTAANELRSEGAKRISQGLTVVARNRVWSDSGSTVSNHSERFKQTSRTPVAPESTTGKENVKAAEDPEERRKRRLAKHFQTRMAQRDGITSSAPIRNTPTSAQKQ